MHEAELNFGVDPIEKFSTLHGGYLWRCIIIVDAKTKRRWNNKAKWIEKAGGCFSIANKLKHRSFKLLFARGSRAHSFKDFQTSDMECWFMFLWNGLSIISTV